jgi:TPR repeat protein
MAANASSTWLAAHGKLWYDDNWYRIAWIVWPQAIAVLVFMLLWAAPASNPAATWAKPLDPGTRVRELLALRDQAITSQPAMDELERAARGGERNAQFYYATLFDPILKLSKIAAPDANKTLDYYSRAADQGDMFAISNLAATYWNGSLVRTDVTRACGYARRVNADGSAFALFIRGECYARGYGGTTADMTQAANSYEAASNKGHARAGAALGWFYENGAGGRPRNSETALRYYRQAAEKNDGLGLHNLASAYNAGLLGLQRDPREAARLIMRALEGKHELSVQLLTTRSDFWTIDFWAQLQRLLGEKGLYTGVVDGRANAATLDAVKRLGSR